MLDDLRSYLQMASGITEATTTKAREVVTALLTTGMSLSSKAVPAPEMMGQVQDLADDLVATSKNNRDVLTGMIRAEVDRAVGRMGFVREDELAALRRHVQRLEVQITELAGASATAHAPATAPAAWPAPAAEPDETDAMADAALDAAQAADEKSSAHEPAAAAEPPVDAAPVDVVGEAAEAPKRKKKKIILDPSGGE